MGYTYFPVEVCSPVFGRMIYNGSHLLVYEYFDSTGECDLNVTMSYEINHCYDDMIIKMVRNPDGLPEIDKEHTLSRIFGDNQCTELLGMATDISRCGGSQGYKCIFSGNYFQQYDCNHPTCEDGCCNIYGTNNLEVVSEGFDDWVSGTSNIYLFILGIVGIIVLCCITCCAFLGMTEIKNK